MTAFLPEGASRPTRRRASELIETTAQFLLQQGVSGSESAVAAPKFATTASAEWHLRLRTYLPRPPEPAPVLRRRRSARRSAATRCSRGTARFGTASALSFALRGPLEAVVYVERLADSQLLVEARTAFAQNDLRSGDVYRFKLWDNDESAPLGSGERVAITTSRAPPPCSPSQTDVLWPAVILRDPT